MPEYLAPGVYVEEVPSGSKPIEGASTSTAGMVGMTQRGPVNAPTLVSSLGAYRQIFGGPLSPQLFPGGRDALPYAAEGFFANGGSRLFVTRVAGPAAAHAAGAVFAFAPAQGAGRALTAAAGAGATALTLDSAAGLAAGGSLLLLDGARSEVAVLLNPAVAPVELALTAPLGAAVANAAAVVAVPTAAIAGVLSAAVAAAATQMTLSSAAGVAVGDVLLIRAAGADRALDEFVTVAGIAAAAPFVATLAAATARAHGADSAILRLGAPAGAATTLAAAVAATAATIPVAALTGFAPGMVVRVGPAATPAFAQVAATRAGVTLTTPLVNAHAAGVSAAAVVPGLTAHAISPGGWANALRVRTRAASQLETTLAEGAAAGADLVRLATAFGVFPGVALRLGAGAAMVTRVVATVDPTAGVVTLTTALAAALPAGAPVASQEFHLFVERIENGKVVESETFEKLSLAAGHPRNALTVVGAWDVARAAPGRTGGSNLIRLEAGAAAATAAFVPDAPMMLTGGADDAAGVTDAVYIGTPSVDPAGRTGLQALENETAVSIVAIPGQTSVAVQNAVINHCERMRYRFAVLDTPLGARLDDARAHRQNYDSTRAAVYYPGVVIPDPFGASGAVRTVAPSGHVIGVYARTDATRGVHKAPANEVVRGILQFETKLGKGEQDILNPLHVNCFRDFREEGRGLRVFGARVATSDPEFKYVNVRRLMLFIEQSLDAGLQWATFEPNEHPLWATVKQSVTNFLVTVWRSGALAGTKQEEAFFVDIGFGSTMTQDDVDNGRMIVVIGVAPVKPAEFVIVRISQKTREAVS